MVTTETIEIERRITVPVDCDVDVYDQETCAEFPERFRMAHPRCVRAMSKTLDLGIRNRLQFDAHQTG